MSTSLSLQNKWYRLYQRHLQGKLSTDDRMNFLIQSGLDAFGMEVAFISHVQDFTYTILYSTITDWVCLQFPLHETYCDITLKHQDTVAIQHMGQSFYVTHPSYKRFKLESYFGTPIRVNGEVFGTLGFAQYSPRQKPFSDTDYQLLNSLAHKAAKTLLPELAY